MPTTQIFETPRSQEGSQQYAGAAMTREWFVWYAASFSAALALVQTAADNPWTPAAGQTLDVKTIEWRSLGAPDCFLFTVTYGSSANGVGGLRPDQFSFRVVASPTHITQSISTLNRIQATDATLPSGTNLTVGAVDTNAAPGTPDTYTPVMTDVGRSIVVYGGAGWNVGTYKIVGVFGGEWVLSGAPAPVGTAGGQWFMVGTAPDLSGAIGQSVDTVQGCEIVVPTCEFTYSQNVNVMTDALLMTFRSVVGKTNKAPFRGYPAGTLLYLGCEPSSAQGTLASGQPFTYWNLAHSFRYEPHVFNVTIGSITVPVKPGHAYLWCFYKPQVPLAGAAILAVQPSYVYVEQVYYPGDYSLLGISL